MNFPTHSLGKWWLCGFGLLISLLIGNWELPSHTAEVPITINNTATANFRTTLNGPSPVGVNSNPTQVPAIVSIINRPALEIIKAGDRVAAEPGDTVIYRLLIRNTGSANANDITITDTLPQGLQFLPNTVRAGISNTNGPLTPLENVTTTVNGRVVTFRYPGTLVPQQQTLSLVYGALVTPDAIRGNGRNLAVSEGTDPLGRYVSNTASHQLQIRRGILSDCGTIVGRVFVDKNFDGQQQPGEPGVPNAVLFMEDGNRVTTDSNGLFSLSQVLAGTHVGTLDLTSLPGYTIAPNLYRIENNSTSRMVNLAPGGLARMNFAVTPTFGEGR
ncbi:DUF11 domain-containing protein [Alkalinema sp. FACHB-956]|uniref:DUF11 domain-containing protein n=1 Tax=Alkalinema sp. FACHB-956 TaxID=2692768 RepID=UPI0016899468|nr:DUF11 domain-containing protein [Alkalinema sp. FACHB-956]MBD2325819.1 DUF11 domain-containing protein [Alkalinema sp. FACHB-956]